MFGRSAQPDEQVSARPAAVVPLHKFDAGWLFLIAGLALLTAAVLIPAQQDLAEAAWLRDRAIAIERQRLDRVDNYARYIAAGEREDDAVVLQLVEAQLNMRPAGRAPLLPGEGLMIEPATIFASLEPAPLKDMDAPEQHSRLGRWTTDERTRLWVIAGGALLVLIGLTPPSRRGRSAQADDEWADEG